MSAFDSPNGYEPLTDINPMETPPSGYKVVGIGDVDSNGTPDLIFQDSGGSTYYQQCEDFPAAGHNEWLPYGTTTKIVGSELPWRVVGVADIDGDGIADLIWRNFTTGQNGYWLMNSAASGGYTIKGAPQYFLTSNDFNWTVVGIPYISSNVHYENNALVNWTSTNGAIASGKSLPMGILNTNATLRIDFSAWSAGGTQYPAESVGFMLENSAGALISSGLSNPLSSTESQYNFYTGSSYNSSDSLFLTASDSQPNSTNPQVLYNRFFQIVY